MRGVAELSEPEILALAISNEEEDARVYADFAHSLREAFPSTAQMFTDMAAEETSHRRQLLDIFIARFGNHVPLVRRQDIRGTPARKPHWQVRPLGVAAVRKHAAQMERDSKEFYRLAASRTSDAGTRRLLGDLADTEAEHELRASDIEARHLTASNRAAENDDARRRLVLQIIQPGLVGLMDGSVSTLAPVFAAAFATREPWNAFLVGLAASLGAGISMGFAEALADDGTLSGRGTPLLRGLVCGLMTVAGGIGHTIPYLIPDFFAATAVAAVVVVLELLLIAYIQWRYMETSPFSAVAKVMFGGALVLATGILIGNAA